MERRPDIRWLGWLMLLSLLFWIAVAWFLWPKETVSALVGIVGTAMLSPEPAGSGSADGNAGPSLPPGDGRRSPPSTLSRACLCPRCHDHCEAEPGSEFCRECTLLWHIGGVCHA